MPIHTEIISLKDQIFYGLCSSISPHFFTTSSWFTSFSASLEEKIGSRWKRIAPNPGKCPMFHTKRWYKMTRRRSHGWRGWLYTGQYWVRSWWKHKNHFLFLDVPGCKHEQQSTESSFHFGMKYFTEIFFTLSTDYCASCLFYLAVPDIKW